MCLGLPMRLVEPMGPGMGWCERDGRRHAVNLMLVGEVEAGSWLLVHLGTAREVIDAETAQKLDDALRAVAVAMAGGDVDPLFGDLAAGGCRDRNG